ncbi:MAG TPA: hypothetical protein VGE07_16115 [Herpetosiphonaceae bacterium]
MYGVPPLPIDRRRSRIWHLFWLLVIGMLGSGAMLFVSTITTPLCQPACHASDLRPLSKETGAFLSLAVVPVATWLAALAYGWGWAGTAVNLVSGCRVLAAPPLTVLLISWWVHQVPSTVRAEAGGLLAIAPPLIGLLLISHLDMFVRPRGAGRGG